MRRQMLVVVFGLLAGASTAWAAPTIDGSVGGGEYSIVLNDFAPETTLAFYNTGLDIDALYFDNASDGGTPYYWMGMTAVNPPIDRNGDPTSYLFTSIVWTVFYDQTNTTPEYMVVADMTAATVGLRLSAWTGAAWTPVALGVGDYTVAVGNALELRIAQSKMPNLDAQPWVRTQLDGTGSWDDDQLTGKIPEPATLGLMGLGLAATLLGRRRR